MLAFCIAWSVCSQVMANPWLQKPGEGIAILTALQYDTDRYFTRSGDSIAQPRFTKRELNPYVEYGWREDWTLGGSIFLHDLSQEDASGTQRTNWGLGNSELFARRRVWEEGRVALSADTLVALPSAYEREEDPRAGRNDYDVAFALNGGYGFRLFEREHFSMLRAAYRYRHGLLRDQVQLEARTGVTLHEDWMLLPEMSLTLPARGISGVATSVAGQNDYRLLRGQISVVYQLAEATRLQTGLFRHLDGADTGGGGGVMVSIWRSF
jgi:hypothetical protein